MNGNTIRLSIALARAEFKLRNEGSYLGILWYLLNPFLLFTLLLFVFQNVFQNNIPLYSLYLLLGVVMFNFFRQVTTDATRVFFEYGPTIKSINFKKEAIVLSVVLRTFLAHIFEIFIFSLILFYMGGASIYLLLYIPILFLFTLFLYGFSLIISMISAYFKDIEQVWSFFTQLLFFATPLFYSLAEQNTVLATVNTFNPLYYFITLAREIVIYKNMPETTILLGVGIFSLLFFFLGMFLFSKLSFRFIENI